MSSLFIIGNGFDLAHDLPTKYSDFKNFILARYPKAEHIISPFDMEYYYGKHYDEIAAQLLVYTMNKSSGPDWNDFENSLGHLHIHDVLPERKNTTNKKGEHDDSNIQEYLLFLGIIADVLKTSTENWQFFFRDWIKSVSQEAWEKSYLQRSSLFELFSKPDNYFLNFNYTKTLQRIYSIKKVIHIHNRVGQKLIFGHGNKNEFYEGGLIGSTTLDNILAAFRKDTLTPMKKYNVFFKKLSQDINKVYSYGFGYAAVDSIYIKTIIQKIAKDAIWYFSEFETANKESLRIKKVKIRNYGFKGNFDVFSG